ncbi:phosphoprotein [Cnidium virus 1]|uniref:Phosphoprotein n=1 Tax=Cnidium virus 1 TaxID=2903266 RepID=A0A8K1XTA6_9RHAB|nr:phosphoprotein [Cnidium virus 1]UGY70980.1 phosphoprotein [Cnidium virus 1]
MQNAGIHPKFAGLPDTAKDSEVVTSQYADIAAKSGHSDDMEQIVDYMKEWDTLLTSKGLTVPNEITGVLSEVSICIERTSNGDSELQGKFGHAIIALCQHILKQNVAPSSVINDMGSLVAKLAEGIDEFRAIEKRVVAALPRTVTKIKSNKIRVTTVPRTDIQDSSLQKDPEIFVPSLKQDKDDDKLSKQGSNNDMQVEEEVHAISQLDPTSDRAKIAREAYAAHYGSPEFNGFDMEKKQQLLFYYINNVLSANPKTWHTDPTLANMLGDLVDKTRLLEVLKKAKVGTLTPDDIGDAVDELIDAINECSSAYGKYKAGAAIHDGIPYIILQNA